MNYFLNKSKNYTFYKDNYNQLIKKSEDDSIKIEKLSKQLDELSLTNAKYKKNINCLKKSIREYKIQIDKFDTLLEKNNSYLNEIKSMNKSLLNAINELNNKSQGIFTICSVLQILLIILQN